MLDRPSGVELLQEARRLLLDEVASKLSGEDRYKVLMVANAMAMAARELAVEPATLVASETALRELLEKAGRSAGDDAQRAFALALREGAFSGSAAAHALLRRQAEIRVGLSNPRALGA